MQEQTKRKSEYSFINIPIEDFLSKDDIDYYQNLKETLSSHVCRNCRNKRLESFSQMLMTIRYFVERKKEDDWKRSLLCGICWYKYYVCVNIKQMTYLLEKCKSSINGSFQRLFLMILPDKKQSMEILVEAIPYLKSHSALLHMWSVRQKIIPSQNSMQFVQASPYQPYNFYQYQFKFTNNIPKVKTGKPINCLSANSNIDTKSNVMNELSSKSEQKSITNNTKDSDISNLFDEAIIMEEIFDKYDIF